jgi:hypothetical protein
MKVRIYAQREDGPEELGAIVLKEGVLVPQPKIPALTNLLREPLIVYDKMKRVLIDSAKEPEKFLHTMPKAVRGAYIWAGEVEE